MTELPSQRDIFANALDSLDKARAGLSDARDWLASDWREDRPLTPAASDARTVAAAAIGAARAAVDSAKLALHDAIDNTPEAQP